MVAIHNPEAFQLKELRRDIETERNDRPDLYLVEFRHIYKLEDYYQGSFEYKCGAGNYSYDSQCVYKKLQSLATSHSCTAPW